MSSRSEIAISIITVFTFAVTSYPLFNAHATLVYPIEEERSPASGITTFLEEVRSEIRNVRQSTQIGAPLRLNSENVEKCSFPEMLGLSEYSDFGPRPVEWFHSKYIRSPGHSDVTDVARFSYLDAYGARYVDGELQIVSDDGLHTVEGQSVRRLSMYHEAASYGVGLGDSAGLSPPLHVRALTLSEFRNEVADVSRECFCDFVLKERLHVVLGMAYYPQYGHSIYNGFSNFMANMWRNGISPRQLEAAEEDNSSSSEDSVSADAKSTGKIAFWPYLFRNTTSLASDVPHTLYSIKWHDAYDELFKIVADSIMSWEVVLNIAKTGPAHRICFERIMVGARPDLDHLNISVPAEMWDLFSRTLISFAFVSDLSYFLNRPFNFRAEVISPEDLFYFDVISFPARRRVEMPHQSVRLYGEAFSSDCSVTFIIREQEGSVPNRKIGNVDELAAVAESMGCGVQTVRFQEMSLREQITQARWNTSVLVGTDGTGLLNALHMRPCSTVLRVEMWRKPGLIARLGPAKWIDYRPKYEDTILLNSSHPISIYLKGMEANGHDMDTLSLVDTPFDSHDLEDFLRNDQMPYVKVDEFKSILAASRLQILQNDCE